MHSHHSSERIQFPGIPVDDFKRCACQWDFEIETSRRTRQCSHGESRLKLGLVVLVRTALIACAGSCSTLAFLGGDRERDTRASVLLPRDRRQERNLAQIGRDVSHQCPVEWLAGHDCQLVRAHGKRGGDAQVQLVAVANNIAQRRLEERGRSQRYSVGFAAQRQGCPLRPRRSSQHRRQQERAAHSPRWAKPVPQAVVVGWSSASALR